MSANDIIDGMVTILWGLAWADHADESRCTSLAGMEITEIMPPAPQEAINLAWRLVGMYEQANGMDVYALYAAAERADQANPEPFARAQRINRNGGILGGEERFGECLAFMAMGHGVSWFDDHAEFPLEVPHVENSDLMILAEDTCDECKANRDGLEG